MTRFNFFLCHRVHRRSCRTHFQGFLQRTLRITSSEMPNVCQAKHLFRFCEICNYIPYDMLHCVFEKRHKYLLHSTGGSDYLTKKAESARSPGRVSRGGKSHLLLTFLPALAYPLEKYKKVQVAPRTLGKYLTARWSCLILS